MHCPWFILVLVNYTSSLCRSFSDGDGLKGVSRPLHVRYISTVTNDDIYLCGSRYSSFASMAIAIGLYATASELITNLLLLIHTLYSSKIPIGVRIFIMMLKYSQTNYWADTSFSSPRSCLRILPISNSASGARRQYCLLWQIRPHQAHGRSRSVHLSSYMSPSACC